MKKLLFITSLLFLSFSLSGCAVVAGTAATLMATKKLPTDLIAQGITGKDCSTLRADKDGGPICRSKNWGKYINKPQYCYRSLGSVDCYDQKDPNRSDDELVGS